MSGLTRRARWLVPVLAVGVLLALVGHGLHGYGPRERPGRLDPASPAGRLLLDETFEHALWLAHPHQNLGALGGAMEAAFGPSEGKEWFAALIRWWAEDESAGARRWPGFGPFAVPPATELTVAVRGDGEVAAAARIRPALAVVAKLAGRLAGNPWLAGGETRQGTVGWQGRDWRLIPGPDAPSPQPAVREVPEATEPALAWLRLGSGRALPAGLYRLHRPPEAASDWELRRATGTPAPLRPAFGAAEERFPGAGVVAAWRRADETLLVFTTNGGEGSEDGLEMPPAAVFRPASRPASGSAERHRLQLPQEALPSFLRGELPEAVEGRWRIQASGTGALAQARRLAPLLALSGRDGGCPALWLDVTEAHRFVARVATVLDDVPLVSRREARRWRDGERLLAGLEGFAHLRVLCSSEGGATDTGDEGWALRFTARASATAAAPPNAD